MTSLLIRIWRYLVPRPAYWDETVDYRGIPSTKVRVSMPPVRPIRSGLLPGARHRKRR